MNREIINKFDAQNKDHVKWLKKLQKVSNNLESRGLGAVCDETPFGTKIKPMDIPELHFCLAMKYVEAVFNHTAWIPQ